jgi:hypothetical protein
MANAPPATGVMFNVQTDNSLTGKEISPQVLQMLLQAAPRPQ